MWRQTGQDEPLIQNEDGEAVGEVKRQDPEISTSIKLISVTLLFMVNTLNYMDRFVVAGVLIQVQSFFGLNNSQGGFLQTFFTLSYLASAPLFGYLGDRYNRKILLLVSLAAWLIATTGASLITDPKMYALFALMRALTGVGEAAYTTIAPTILTDMFPPSTRSVAFYVFNSAIPVGSGLGFICGPAAALSFGSWHWALRVAPFCGTIILMLLTIFLPNVKRGAYDEVLTNTNDEEVDVEVSYMEEIRAMLKSRCYVYTCAGQTFLCFATGALAYWGPNLIALGEIVSGKLEPCTGSNCEYTSVAFVFGLLLALSGFFGTLAGQQVAKYTKKKITEGDALVSAASLLLAGPILFIGLEFIVKAISLSWVLVFFCCLFTSFTWVPVTDITMYINPKSRRATANAFQISVMHLFGDAISPFVLGTISDKLAFGKPDTYYTKFYSLKYSFYLLPFSIVFGSLFFFLASLFLKSDVDAVAQEMKDRIRGIGATQPPPQATNQLSVD